MLPAFLVLCVFFSGVTSWTVNLDEVKKYLVENEVSSENGGDVTNIESNGLDEDYESDLEYQSYKEKEVNSIIRNGSVYLEGLSKALMTYRNTLNNCSNVNTTSPDLSKEQQDKLSVCSTAANNSEYVQKLSELALLTINELRDKAYEKTSKDDERSENELLLQLAWLLDRLAYLTGYEPDPQQYIAVDKEELSTTTEINEIQDTTETVKTDSLEILEQTENGRMSKFPPKTTPVKTIRKRSAEPLESVVNYYIKYKIWNGTNSVNNINNGDSFDVRNDLRIKPISKRSIKKKFNIRRNKKIKH